MDIQALCRDGGGRDAACGKLEEKVGALIQEVRRLAAGMQTSRVAGELDFDVLLLDINLPELNGTVGPRRC